MILHQRAVWFLYVVVAAFSFAVGTLAELYRQIVERQAAEHERRKAELALYKVQINPHFLFNTLNTLYGLMLTDVSRGRDGVHAVHGPDQIHVHQRRKG